LNTFILEDNKDVIINVFEKLSNDRILFISDFIDDNLSSYIVASLLLKNSEDSTSKISIVINSEGGDIRNVFMIYDIMKMIDAPIETICIGCAMNESVILLASGTPGMRYATKNSVICPSQLIHDKSYYSDLTDAKTTLDQVKDDNDKKMEILAKCTGKTFKRVMHDFNRKKFMTPKQAKDYGIIDGIVNYNHKKL
jgi:ATP-dependent Clp protease protease subunit